MSLSLSDAIQQFDDAMIGQLADSSRQWYTYRMQGLADFFGPARPVGEISVADMRAWRRHLSEIPTKYGEQRPLVNEGLSPEYINGYIRAVKRLFNWLVEEGEIEVSPAGSLKQSRRKRREPRAIAEPDYQKMLTVAQETNVRDLAIILFLADTGCRVGGIANLKLSDVHLDRHQQRGHAVVTEKGDQSRVVYFNQTTYRAIVAYLINRPLNAGDYLFIGERGPLSSSGIYQMLKRLAKKAGVTGRYNPHAFRHRFARVVLQNGGNLAALARMLGHSDTAVTAQYYALFTIDELRDLHEAVDPAAPVKAPHLQQRT